MRTIRTTILLTALLLCHSLQGQPARVELRSLSVPGAGSWQFNVYLPSGYDQSSQRYPVLYLFRGAVDEWMDRTEDASRAGRNIQSITDTLVAQGLMGNVILVMPGFTAMTGPATEADYTFILTTLIPYVDQQYRTLPGRWFRGVDGFSLGGLHMINLIWRNPERFASAGSYDGTLSMFDFNQMLTAGETFFARSRPIQFLLHSAAVQPSNLGINRRVDSLFRSFAITNVFPDLLFSTTSQHNWWNADEHMIRSLPLHWSKFQTPPNNVSVGLRTSIPAQASGTLHLAWSTGQSKEPLKTLAEYSRDSGISWQTLTFIATGDSTYDWNTQNVPDGTRYILRLRVIGDTTCGTVQSQRFAVDNPGNSPPDVTFLSPLKGERISGTYRIAWTAEDPEGDAIRVSILGSADNGVSWSIIASDLANSGAYTWDSQTAQNAPLYLLKLRCSDGVSTSEMVSSPMQVQNVRQTLGSLRHTTGTSDGRVTVNIVSPSQLTGHTYKVAFDDTSSSRKTYSVFDVTKNSFALQKISYIGDGTEGPSFDGVRLSVFDPPAATNNADSTRWSRGKSTLTAQVSVPTILVGNDTVRGTAYPADYEIRISDHIVDTSSGFLGSTATPLYFSVWNISENRRATVVLGELDGGGKISRFDEVYILEKNRTGEPGITWEIFFTGDDKVILPAPGDVFALKTVKPIRSGDTFEFAAVATGLSENDHGLPLQLELSQNYPNPFNPRTAIQYHVAATGLVELSVFDILGRAISTLVRSIHTPGTYTISLDAAGLSSGIYFYQLRAAGSVITKRALLLK